MPQTPLHKRLRRMYIFFMIMWDFLTPLNDLKELCNQFDLDMWILQEIRTTRYLWGCSPVLKLGNINLPWEYAQSPADHHCFINMLCVSPDVFDVILSFIHDNPVFYNNSNNPQAPVTIGCYALLPRPLWQWCISRRCHADSRYIGRFHGELYKSLHRCH